MPSDLLTLASGRGRIIFIRVHDSSEPAPEQAWLEENATLIDEKSIGQVKIYYFKPQDTQVNFQ